MATPAVTYTFAANTLVKASEANTNFQDIVDFLTSEVVHKDGSVAFTAHASGPASDPTADNQYSRKAYVDSRLQVRTYGMLNGAIVAQSATADIPIGWDGTTGITISSAGTIVMLATLEVQFTAGTSEQEVTFTGVNCSILGANSVVIRGTGTFKANVPFLLTASPSVGTWEPKIRVSNGTNPISTRIEDVGCVLLKVATSGTF